MGASAGTGRRAAAVRGQIGWVAAGLDGAGLLAALLIAPTDAVQGNVQRLMYLHVPAAWTGYLAFAVVLGCAVACLMTGSLRFDRYAQVAAEVGVVATAVAIGVGSVWGRAVWGVWWTWDPRLVSTALLLLVYAGYLAVRRLTGDPRRDARRGAMLGAAGFILVPVVHFSVVWWRSLHQPATILAPNTDPPIDALMAATLLLCTVAVMATAAWAYLYRLRRLASAAAPEPEATVDRQPTVDRQLTGAGRRHR